MTLKIIRLLPQLGFYLFIVLLALGAFIKIIRQRRGWAKN
jgi:hypothetical protein